MPPEPSPGPADAAPGSAASPSAPVAGSEPVVLRRRREDWGGRPRDQDSDTAWAARRGAVQAASATLAAHDAQTARHADDVVTLAAVIAERLGVDTEERAHVLAAAQLHDVGKIEIPREILEKPGPLDREEWGLVRNHTVAGEGILSGVAEMDEVARIVRHSHERWDGHGYPDGLAGEDIPLASRIVFCADAFHAIRCDRPYRPGRSADHALVEVRANAGTQFDPRVVDALEETAKELRDSAAARARALAGGLRSRRAAVLLLTLTLAGGAAAAERSLEWLLPVAGGQSAAASPCPPPGKLCRLAELGRLGVLPSRAASRSAASTDHHGAGVAPKTRPRRVAALTEERASSARPAQGRAGRPAGPGVRRPAAPAGGAPMPSHGAPAAPVGPAAPERPNGPGRSEEAPRRSPQPGTPLGGAPGRSEEAPGKPAAPPGAFGKGRG